MIHSFSILPQHERRLPTSAAGEGRARASLSFSRMLAMIAGHSSPFRRPSLAAFRPSFKSFSPDATKAQASGFPLSRSHRPAGTALFFSARAESLTRQTSRVWGETGLRIVSEAGRIFGKQSKYPFLPLSFELVTKLCPSLCA